MMDSDTSHNLSRIYISLLLSIKTTFDADFSVQTLSSITRISLKVSNTDVSNTKSDKTYNIDLSTQRLSSIARIMPNVSKLNLKIHPQSVPLHFRILSIRKSRRQNLSRVRVKAIPEM